MKSELSDPIINSSPRMPGLLFQEASQFSLLFDTIIPAHWLPVKTS